MALALIRRILCCFRHPQRDADNEAAAPAPGGAFALGAEAFATVTLVQKKGGKADAPEAITKQYQKVIPHSVEIEGQGVCLTSDVAVLGDVAISAGGTCITGNVLVFGDVRVDGKDGKTVSGTCITGHAIILGDVYVRGDVCVESDVFVKGDIKVEGKLKVGGKLCYWGQKDVRPLPPS